MMRPERAEGYDIELCSNQQCRGWGTILARQETGSGLALVELTCPECNGTGRKLVKKTYKKLIDNAMNEELDEMPSGVSVQLRVLILRHSNEVWTLGRKLPDGSISVVGFRESDCRVLGWRLID